MEDEGALSIESLGMTVRTGSLFGPVARGDDEHVETLASSVGGRVERIVSHGHVSPPGFWYDQDQQEWALVAQGTAELEIEDERGERGRVRLAAGDWILIPAHVRHRVTYTSDDPPCVWAAAFLPPCS